MPNADDLRALLNDQAFLHGFITSVVLVVGVFMLRIAATRVVRKTKWATDDDRLRWLTSVRHASVIMLVLGLVLIWGNELRTLAVSIVAIAAAVVLATKELILCFTGGVLRTTARSFSLGDRIEIAGMRGDVIANGLLTTTIRELGPGHQWTGRALVVPNSLFLSNTVINESFTARFVLHLFTVPLSSSDDWRRAEEQLLDAAREACADFQEEATEQLIRLASEQGLSAPATEPRVSFQIPDAGKLHLHVRIPAPTHAKGRIEQQILRQFIEQQAQPGA